MYNNFILFYKGDGIMKKFLTLLLAVITMFVFTTSASAKTVIKGDLDGNGKITAADARGTLRISAKLEKADDTQMLIVDVTNDKKVTAADARSILRVSAKLEPAFGEIEVGGSTETETTTVADKETTTVADKETTTAPITRTEMSGIIKKNIDSYIKELGLKKTDGKYTNGKITIVSDPSIIDDNKISSITVYDAEYLLNDVSVDMTPAKAADTLKKADWIVKTQDSDEIVLIKNKVKMVVSLSDGKITSIEYAFAESLLDPDETTTVPVTETTTSSGEETTKPADDGEHKHSYVATILAPTCTEKGYTTFSCIFCTDSYTADETAPKGHDYTSIVINPTCTEDGFTKYTCSRCADEYTDNKVSAKGHDAGWVSVREPAPGVEGLDQYKCRICSEVLNEATRPALPLPETTTEEPTTEEPTTEEPTTEEPTTEEPTTEEPTTEEPTTEHTHDYNVSVVVPTCTENGYTRFTCKECSYSYDNDIVPATGHNAVWEITTPAGVGTEGLEQKICKTCNTVVEEKILPALKEEEIETPEGEITVDQLPSQVKAFMNGHFGIEGYTYSGKEKSPISMYVSANHVKAGMDLNGMKIDMLIRDVNKKNPSVYIVRPDVKKYAKLTALDMATLGITVDDLKIDIGGGMANPDSIILSTQTISGEKYDIYTIYAGTEYCKIYMIGENIKRIETYNTDSKMLTTRIDVTTFVAEPGDNAFSVDGYKRAISYISLFDLI